MQQVVEDELGDFLAVAAVEVVDIELELAALGGRLFPATVGAAVAGALECC